jgi:hypothetical protein
MTNKGARLRRLTGSTFWEHAHDHGEPSDGHAVGRGGGRGFPCAAGRVGHPGGHRVFLVVFHLLGRAQGRRRLDEPQKTGGLPDVREK